MKKISGKIEVQIFVDEKDPNKCDKNCPFLTTVTHIIKCVLFDKRVGQKVGQRGKEEFQVARTKECLKAFPDS